jgi:hypothetical protein
MRLHWRGGDTLALEYVRAKQQRLMRPRLSGPSGPVTVVLVRGVVDSTAAQVRRR